MNLTAVLPWLIAISAGMAVFFTIIAFVMNNKRTVREQEMDDFISGIIEDEEDENRKAAGIPNPKTWYGYWYKLGTGAGIDQEGNPQKLGTLALVTAGVAFLMGAFVWPGDILIGFVFAGISLFIVRTLLIMEANKRILKIDKQLPLLLSGMRANLSANMTHQKAVLSQATEIPAPLGDELMLLKSEVEVNIPLDKALENFAKRIPSKEVHFLVASIRVAISQGSDLDDLLVTLQDIMQKRAGIRDKLATAIAQAQPAIYITAVAIPLGLVFSYMSDERNRQFWFSFPGLLAFTFISFCYAGSLFLANKQVNKVKKA